MVFLSKLTARNLSTEKSKFMISFVKTLLINVVAQYAKMMRGKTLKAFFEIMVDFFLCGKQMDFYPHL